MSERYRVTGLGYGYAVVDTSHPLLRDDIVPSRDHPAVVDHDAKRKPMEARAEELNAQDGQGGSREAAAMALLDLVDALPENATLEVFAFGSGVYNVTVRERTEWADDPDGLAQVCRNLLARLKGSAE